MAAEKYTQKKDIRTVSTGLVVVPSWLMNVRSSFSFYFSLGGGGGGGAGCASPESALGVPTVIKMHLSFLFHTYLGFLPNFNILSIPVVKI